MQLKLQISRKCYFAMNNEVYNKIAFPSFISLEDFTLHDEKYLQVIS